MGIQGKGSGLSQQIYGALKPVEEQLRTLTELRADAPIPDGKHALLERARALDAEIAAVASFEAAPSPAVRAAASAVLGTLRHRRLELEDPVFARYVREIERRHDGSASGGITEPELVTMLALTGDRLSDAELQALRLAEPLLAPNLGERLLEPAIAENYKTRRNDPAFRSSAAKVGAAAVLPVAIPLVASAALKSVSPVLAFATAAGGLALGADVGAYLQRRASDVDGYGVNRLDGVPVDGEVSRLRARAGDDKHFLAEPERLRGAARREATIVRQLVPETSTAPAERALLDYASALEAAAAGSDPRAGVAAARAALAAGPATPSAVRAAGPASPEAFDAAVETLVFAQNDRLLALSNPALFRKLADLDRAHGFTSGRAGAPLPPAEREALAFLAGASPSLAEFVALARLERAGLLKVDELFPGQALPPAAGLSSADVRELIDSLGARAGASRTQKLGDGLKVAIKYLSALAATGLAFSSAGIPAAMAVMIASRVGGTVLGNYLSGTADRAKVTAGLELAEARPVGLESALLYGRISAPGWPAVPAGGSLRDGLRQEADLVGSVLRSALASRAELAPPLREAFDAAQGELLSALVGFHAELSAIAAGAPDGELRERTAAARASLFAPSLGYALVGAILPSRTVPEVPTVLTRHLEAKQELLPKLAALAADGEATSYQSLVKTARAAADSKKQLPRKLKKALGEDDLDRLISKILKDPFRAIDRAELARLVAGSEASHQALYEKFVTLSPIGAPRAEAIANEFVAALFEQIYPLFGQPLDGDVPKLGAAKVAVEKGEDGLPSYAVTGALPGGGSVSLKVSAYGLPDLSSIRVDLGEELLGRLATQAVAREVALRRPGEPVPGRARRLADRSLDPRGAPLGAPRIDVFEVTVGTTQLRLGMTPDGFPLLDTLRPA